MKNIYTVVGALLCLTLASCSTGSGSYPHMTNPPPFDYGDGDDLRSSMHQLAYELQKLDESLRSEIDSNLPDQQAVISNLRDIERIGNSLQSGDLSSKHQFLQDGMDKFLENVSMARRDATRGRYYMAGRLAGACVSCHTANY